jgi:glycosyltransferase involved in cell wall biosynthesis
MTDIVSRNKSNVCIIIPSFNNAKTLGNVILQTQKYCKDVFVVNDGSTDNTLDVLNKINGFKLVSYEKNKGKGFAIRKGFKAALDDGFEYAITIDSDGQHFPEDIAKVMLKHEKNPGALLIGSRNIEAEGMPSKNTFANKFSNFWYWAETGQKLPDTQSGFRLYPIGKYKNTKWFTTKYEFEIEVLVRSNWSNIKTIPIPIRVYYPPKEERVSHFKPLKDFTRISILNTFLVLITYLYIMPLRFFKYLLNNKFTTVVKEQITLHNENPMKMSAAMGFGIFMGITPIWGFQMLVAVLLSHFFKLNKVLVLAFSNISLPPVIPFIVYLSYKTGGLFFANSVDFNMETMDYLKQQISDGQFYKTLNEFGYSILQYISGSLVLGIVAGGLVAIVSYLIINFVNLKKTAIK